MKRRNAEIPKLRRPVKRNKITEGMYGSTLLYLKFLVVWILVILADFILEFRFEFLWPFYLLLRSVYDSFKYQGLAFSMLFVFVALTSDMLCFFFIPAHWMFFAASTYVWVQYVWHTDKGVCAPTILLWILFVYLEAAVRLRDVKHMPGYLDLCRPFAAHCIGYPVVTLGFGLKSYVGYRIRQRKQREVAKENEFYMQLMQQALPVVDLSPSAATTPSPAVAPSPASSPLNALVSANADKVATSNTTQPQIQHQEAASQRRSQQNHDKNSISTNSALVSSSNNSATPHHKSFRQHKVGSTAAAHLNHANGHAVGAGIEDSSSPGTTQETNDSRSSRRREKRDQEKERDRESEYVLQKLEGEARRLRSDLQGSRASEQELRLQVAALTTSEKVSRGELSTMQREIEDLQQRLQSAVSSKNSDKQTIGNLERRVAEERRVRCSVESQLNQERKSRKQEQVRSGECTESCRSRRRELEAELTECRAAKRWSDERYAALERDNGQLLDQLRDRDMLMSALSAMQEKNAHLENSLSAETRIKLDLFSALGEAKRQLEIRESSVRTKESEIEELKSKIAQVLAVMPNDHFTTGPSAQNSRVRLTEVSPTTATPPPGSTLDPNATAYTPKCSSEA